MRLNVMIPMLLVLSGLAACSRTTSPERYTAVAASRTMANHELCPDLVGTFRFDGQGAAMRPFLDQAPASHAPTLLTIDGEPNASTYRFRTGIHEALFRNQVADMQRRGNDEYAEWRQRVLAHAAGVAKGERSEPLARAVAELGPVPTHAGVLSRGQCEEHWMRLPDVDPNAYRDVAAGDSVDRSDLELWAARDAEGALLLDSIDID
ncbi:MAG: hypothetical protein IPK97_09650 [Ahniella sp.]|nr:hypothetical protein [Ahniella sp.]